jgi:hypothetical protein
MYAELVLGCPVVTPNFFPQEGSRGIGLDNATLPEIPSGISIFCKEFVYASTKLRYYFGIFGILCEVLPLIRIIH